MFWAKLFRQIDQVLKLSVVKMPLEYNDFHYACTENSIRHAEQKHTSFSLPFLLCDRNAGHDKVMILYYLIVTYNVGHPLVGTFESLI
jgi:hypothetical protein